MAVVAEAEWEAVTVAGFVVRVVVTVVLPAVVSVGRTRTFVGEVTGVSTCKRVSVGVADMPVVTLVFCDSGDGDGMVAGTDVPVVMLVFTRIFSPGWMHPLKRMNRTTSVTITINTAAIIRYGIRPFPTRPGFSFFRAAAYPPPYADTPPPP